MLYPEILRQAFKSLRQLIYKRAGLLTALAVLFLLSPALANSATPAQTAQPSEVTLTGTFNIIWGDPAPGDPTPPSTTYSLAEDSGQVYQLSFDPRLADRLVNLYTKRITITGTFNPPAKNSLKSEPVVAVDKLDIAPDSGPRTNLVGNNKFLSIMCKFSDSALVEPRPLLFFQNQLGDTRPGFNNYIKEMSYGAANLDNSQAVGWVTLPSPRSAYVSDTNTILNQLAKDCATASGRTDLKSFYGLNFMFNGSLGCCAWGGSVFINNANGQTGVWRATWMPYLGEASTFGWREHGILAHEISHAFGSLHSGSSNGYQYGSSWDVVSNPQANCTLTAIDPVYGCLGQGIVSYNRDTMGFIPSGRKVVYDRSQGTQTYNLDFLSLTTPSNASSKYEIAVPSLAKPNSRYYTVEARRQEGYDSKLPLSQAVLIHDVDTTRGGSDPNAPIAYLFPPPGATPDATRWDTNVGRGVGAANANWAVGQTLTDSTNQITIKVVAATSSGFTIQVGPPQPVVLVPVVVTQNIDNSTSQVNTLSWAINQATTNTSYNAITFNLSGDANNTVTVSGVLPAIPAGLTIQGKDCTNTAASPIIIDGQGSAARLNLGAGNITLMGLTIKGFAGPQILVTNTTNKKPVKFQCTVVRKS